MLQSQRPLVIAIDIGTTSVRSMIVAADGEVLASAQERYTTLQPRPYHEEQDPVLVATATYRAIQQCTQSAGDAARQIVAMGVSSQMYSVLALDADGAPLTNSMIWADARAETQAHQLRAEFGWRLYHKTGCPPSSMFPVAKIRWLREQDPDRFARCAEFMSIKEYVLRPFLAERVVDASVASSMGLLDIHYGDWSDDALAFADLQRAQLPMPCSGLIVFAAANPAFCRQLGLPTSLPIVLAGGDGPLASIGAGALTPGVINVDLGTSGAARLISQRAITDEATGLWCFRLTDDLWTVGGILTNVGNALEWLIKRLALTLPADGEQNANLWQAIADRIPDDSDGLFFLPYLRRPRSPHWDDQLSGTLFGLRAEHHIGHITRALLEAIGYDLRAIIAALERHGGVIDAIQLTGGVARLPATREILADILGKRVSVIEQTEASLRGAAAFAFAGVGVMPLDAFASANLATAAEIQPDAHRHQRYTAKYLVHHQLIDISRQASTILHIA